MNDEKTNRLLLTISSFGSSEEYLILSRQELLSQAAGITEKEMDAAFLELQALECVEIRYSDNDLYCVKLLPKGVLRCDKIKEDQERQREKEARRQEEKAKREQEKRERQYHPEDIVVSVPVAVSEESHAESQLVHVETKVVVPWKKIAWFCVGIGLAGAFIGGLVGALLAKLL